MTANYDGTNSFSNSGGLTDTSTSRNVPRCSAGIYFFLNRDYLLFALILRLFFWYCTYAVTSASTRVAGFKFAAVSLLLNLRRSNENIPMKNGF